MLYMSKPIKYKGVIAGLSTDESEGHFRIIIQKEGLLGGKYQFDDILIQSKKFVKHLLDKIGTRHPREMKLDLAEIEIIITPKD